MVIDLIFKALLLLCCVRHAGSGLSLYAYRSIGTDEINGLDEEIDIECNSNFSLWCEVKPYIDSATWEINGKSAALCFHGNCFEYPPFPENHMFSMNTTTGDFIMDVSPVTNATNGNTYKCDDGQNSRSVIPVIKAFPTSQTLKIDTSENTKITVTTGCVFPKKETDLDFDWFISKNNVNPSKEEALSAISNISTVNECTETNCAGLDTAYFNVTATFEVYDEEESYYICVKVTHIDAKSRPAEICSDRQYQVLKKSNPLTTIPNTSTIQSSNKPKENILFGLDKNTLIGVCVAVVVVLLIIVIIVVYICKQRGKKNQTGENGITLSSKAVKSERRK